jgi:hypothetical protein
MPKLKDFFFLALAFVTASAQAGQAVLTVGGVANPACVAGVPESGAQALNYSVSGGSTGNKAMIDSVVNTLIKNNANNLQDALRGFHFEISQVGLKGTTPGVKNAAGVASCGNKRISLDAQQLQDPKIGVSVIAHEICHCIGSARGRGATNYSKYYRAVGETRCDVSLYCENSFDSHGNITGTTTRAEEFAEVCAANLVAPGHTMAQGTSSCKAADSFMHSQLFGAPSPSCNATAASMTGWQDMGGKFNKSNTAPSSSSGLFTTRECDDEDSNDETECPTVGGLGDGQALISILALIMQHNQPQSTGQIRVIPRTTEPGEANPDMRP